MSRNKFITDTKAFDKAVKYYRDLPKEMQSNLDTIVKASAVTALEQALITSPLDEGFLRRSHFIRKTRNIKPENVSWTVGNGAPYAPYLEFGTIDKVDVPRGFRAFAKQFKSKNAVRESGGINPQPWMIPAMRRGYLELEIFLSRTVRKFFNQ